MHEAMFTAKMYANDSFVFETVFFFHSSCANFQDQETSASHETAFLQPSIVIT